MSFYQNPFEHEYHGVMLVDAGQQLDFVIGPNKNNSTRMIAWNVESYDLTTYVNFAISWSLNGGRDYAKFHYSFTPGIYTALQVADILNAQASFSGIFTASSEHTRLVISAKEPLPYSMNGFKVYINNTPAPGESATSAEQAFGFNLKAPVREMPSYFDRHTVANSRTYTNSLACLVDVDESTEAWVLTRLGLSITPRTDWELMAGRSNQYKFHKRVINGTNQVTSDIEYNAGSVAGDLAMKTTYFYTAPTDTTAAVQASVPYVLQSGDLITPP